MWAGSRSASKLIKSDDRDLMVSSTWAHHGAKFDGSGSAFSASGETAAMMIFRSRAGSVLRRVLRRGSGLLTGAIGGTAGYATGGGGGS